MKSIIFDVDGVIVDVRESYHIAIKRTAEHFLGKEVSLNLIRKIKFSKAINNDWDVTMEVIRELGGDADYDRLVEVFTGIYDSLKDKEKPLLPRELFIRLREEGVPLGVVTGRPRRDLMYVLERLNIGKFFDCTVDEDHIPNPSLRKPHPYPLKLCIERLGSDKSLYIGDNVADFMMVRDAKKMYSLDVGFVHFKKVVKDELEAVFSTDDPGELLSFLTQWASLSPEEAREFRP